MEQILLFALLKSSLYALVALGFTLIFSVGGILNLAHGAMLMAGGYFALIAFQFLGVPLELAIMLAIAASALLAAALYWCIVRHIQYSGVLTLVVTLSFALALQIGAVIAFGVNARSLEPVIGGISLIANVSVENVRIAAFASSWLALLLFWLLVERTKLGKAIRAISMSQKGAALAGIRIERTYLWTWAISGALAGLAGIFFAYPGGISPTMWIDPLIISFAIVILGGIGSLSGSIIAAYLIGFVETFTFYAPQLKVPLGAAWVGVPSLLITILILIFRPRGLLGKPVE
ncbi:branched-chain amino acid ABC transporter permease [Candidatus Acetothermia bacterium]|nr:branched-chain amino acid ABC transporter permease [Candidatus Acetothermia bacterium]MBI3643258.1 branched-chain amino acid ABC transporter permease [Candidatus Acetothermia bacterium]